MRSETEVPFPANCWLKRYLDELEWHSILSGEVIWEMQKHHPHDWERQLWLMKEGHMSVETPYAEYMYLADSAYQDELPFNHHLNYEGRR